MNTRSLTQKLRVTETIAAVGIAFSMLVGCGGGEQKATPQPIRYGKGVKSTRPEISSIERLKFMQQLLDRGAEINLKVKPQNSATLPEHGSFGTLELIHLNPSTGETCTVVSKNFSINHCCIDMLLVHVPAHKTNITVSPPGCFKTHFADIAQNLSAEEFGIRLLGGGNADDFHFEHQNGSMTLNLVSSSDDGDRHPTGWETHPHPTVRFTALPSWGTEFEDPAQGSDVRRNHILGVWQLNSIRSADAAAIP